MGKVRFYLALPIDESSANFPFDPNVPYGIAQGNHADTGISQIRFGSPPDIQPRDGNGYPTPCKVFLDEDVTLAKKITVEPLANNQVIIKTYDANGVLVDSDGHCFLEMEFPG